VYPLAREKREKIYPHAIIVLRDIAAFESLTPLLPVCRVVS